MIPRENVFSNSQALIEALADSIAADLHHAVETRGQASLVVSGGHTPVPLFKELSLEPVPWPSVWVTLADERWVPPDSPDSNEALVRQSLLTGPAAHAHFVGLKNASQTPGQGEAGCSESLKPVPRPFDVVILGMGDDGHTASLFPKAPQLTDAIDPDGRATCMAIDPVTASHPRMTLTLAALLDSRRIILHIVGDNKWQVYKKACAPGPVSEFPIRSVLQQTKVPVDVYWSP